MSSGGGFRFMKPPKSGCPRPKSIAEMIEIKGK
ncbi:hypothetical protein P46FS4_130 [Salmonella phage P46FS4]|uniref:Uncharacterized protein n=1 Tax=Salmonella phage P46FS4 TaxID=2712940 RepID=A0A6G6XUR1_9CAUD|nr:hypothetical protein HYQ39_gp130 [Salmonella phage P46FS4]QIG62196.1 hypothetical protein P46FS4_130 [Salmonella phage P46FS4]